MLLTFMRTSWKSPFLRPAFGRDDVDEDVADRGAGLVRDLQALELLDLGDVEVLARHDLRGLADIFDLGDGDEAALVVADDEGLPGIGAHVHLARHHLLHGEIAGGHRELLELDAALLEQAGLEQIVGRHAPDVGLVALADRSRARRPAARFRGPPPARRRRAGEILPSCASSSSRRSSVMRAPTLCSSLALIDPNHCSCCMPNSRMLAATSSSVCVITCRNSCRRRRHRDRAGLLDHGAVFRRGDDRRDLALQLVEDRLRRAGAGADAEPAEAHEVDALLRQRRNFRQVLQALGRRHRRGS